jgi:hypothetical protein
MAEQNQRKIEELIHSVRGRRSSLETLTERLRTPQIEAAFNKGDYNCWCTSVAGDALIRVRLFTEQNFNFVETMGVIAVARYLFELSVWLHLFKIDRRHGLVYFHRLLETQERYYKDQKAQLSREVAMLESFDLRERQAHERVLGQAKFGSPNDARESASSLKAISEAIDLEAAKAFSMYAADARTNGYGFQAHQVKNKAMPAVEQALAQIALERARFDATVPQDIKDLIPGRWQWRQMAQKVNLTDEYDYIYAFASKLLHAEPVSITTNQKNLELPELQLFLRYIDVKIAELLSLAETFVTGDERVA